MKRQTVWAACGISLLLALGLSGCKKRQAPVANRLAPVATQAAKVAVPPVVHPNVSPQSPALQHEKSGYVTSARTQMDQMQPQIAQMQATTWRTAGPNRILYDKLLRDVAAKRATLQMDVASIPNAPPEGWPALKAKSDRDLVALRGAFVAASSRIVAVAPQRTAAVPARLTP